MGKMRQILIPCVRNSHIRGRGFPLACIVLRCADGGPPRAETLPAKGLARKVGALSRTGLEQTMTTVPWGARSRLREAEWKPFRLEKVESGIEPRSKLKLAGYITSEARVFMEKSGPLSFSRTLLWMLQAPFIATIFFASYFFCPLCWTEM